MSLSGYAIYAGRAPTSALALLVQVVAVAGLRSNQHASIHDRAMMSTIVTSNSIAWTDDKRTAEACRSSCDSFTPPKAQGTLSIRANTIRPTPWPGCLQNKYYIPRQTLHDCTSQKAVRLRHACALRSVRCRRLPLHYACSSD